MELTVQDLRDINFAREVINDRKLAARRAAARLNRAELAAAVGCTSEALAQWEAGRRTPRSEPALRLGRVLRELEVAS